MFFVIVGRNSLQVWETESTTLPDGFRTRQEAEQWIEEYTKARKAVKQPSSLPVILSDAPRISTFTTQTPHLVENTSRSITHPAILSMNDRQMIGLPAVIPADIAPPVDQIVLSVEQQRVLDIVKRGDSVFFTGPAGTGKSVLLRTIVRTLRGLRPEAGSLAITAPTGIAGLNIGGLTIHSFAGIGLGKEDEVSLAKRLRNSRKYSQRWRDLKTLIIDEISMLEGRLFDKLEFIARFVRWKEDAFGVKRLNEKPFGGIQLILSGDFCQLPPVPDESHKHRLTSTFCFDAKSWSSCITQPPVRLTKVFRQKDPEFVDILSAMRVGELSDEQIEKLARLSRPLKYEDGIEPTELYPTRAEVDACNQKRLHALTGASHTFCAMDRAGCDVHGNPIPKEDAIKLLDKVSIVLQTVTFKVGSQVMLIKNILQGSLVNGSTGKIIEFISTAEALKRQIQISCPNRPERTEDAPLRVVTSPENMVPLNSAVFSRNQLFPLVQFTNGLLLLCAPVNFSVEGFLGNVECERLQVPLLLAWAMSVHKSQGQTLTRVKVDLKRIFEKGQTYVAISRATTMEHLEIQNFNPVKIQAHPRVLAWEAEWMPRSVVPPSAESVTEPVAPRQSPHRAVKTEHDIDEEMRNPYETEEVNRTPRNQTIYAQNEPDDDAFWGEMDSEDAMNHYYR